MDLNPTRRRFTVDEYHRLGEAGILDEDERVELIEGEIVEMGPVDHRHPGIVDRLTHALYARLGNRTIVRVQRPISLPSNDSEPRPDVTLLRPRADFYARSHPRPEDVFLVAEVMNPFVGWDRRIKLLLYAPAGVPEVWLVDPNTGCVEVCRRPTPDGYRDVRNVTRDESLTIHTFPDVAFTVADLLG